MTAQHRAIARSFASDHVRNRDDRKAARTIGLFAVILACLMVAGLFVVTN